MSYDCSEMALSARTVSSGLQIRLEGGSVFLDRDSSWMDGDGLREVKGRKTFLEKEKNIRLNKGHNWHDLVMSVVSIVHVSPLEIRLGHVELLIRHRKGRLAPHRETGDGRPCFLEWAPRESAGGAHPDLHETAIKAFHGS